MKMFKKNYLFIILFTFAFSNSFAIVPTTPKIAAQAYVIQDFKSKQLLIQKNIYKRVEPASLTKLMTAYAVFQELKNGNLKLEDKVTISEKAWKIEGSRMYLKQNSRVSVKLLITGMIVQSGNDASIALAEHIAGSEDSFVDLMNQYAKGLGMKNTHYMNCTGMNHVEHYTNVSDLLKIVTALITEFPEYYKLYSQKEFTYGKIKQLNRNKLLWWDDAVDGIKTGYTKNAGYCLVASMRKNKMHLISIVMGTSSEKARAVESKKMLRYVMHFFESHILYKGQQVIDSIRVRYGNIRELKLGLKKPLYVTIPKGSYKNLKPSIKLKINRNKIRVPIVANTVYGTLEIKLNNKIIAKRALISLENINKGNWYQQVIDYAWSLYEQI
jgi:D-alanyl-D-alanine carboxypeptidase (penicillin-binding protein 5/6)